MRSMLSVGRWHLVLTNALVTVLICYLFSRQQENGTTYRPSSSTPRTRVVLYNRIPKTGSTTLTNALGYDLVKQNEFNVIHVNITKNRAVFSLQDQLEFVRNVSEWTERQPAFYHGHFAFVDFTRFGYQNPIYINVIREPLERLLSHYYFLRYGDNFRVGLKRSRAGNNETFDDCVANGRHDCDFKHLWMSIPYFCGHQHFCTEPGSALALEEAKRNLVQHYLLVGVSERLRDFIALVEKVPMFRGALKHFDSLDENRAHLRYTKKKIPPSEHTISIVKQSEIYRMERQFYDFVLAHFDYNFKRATNMTGRIENLMGPQFHYEKIKPEVPLQ